jgi:hypothetical protein
MESIGVRIESVFKESGMQPKFFASQIHVSPRNVYNIFTRDTIDTAQLFTICKVLKFDFFKYFSEQLKREDTAFLEDPAAEYKKRLKRKVMIEVELSDDDYYKLIEKSVAR